jgi:Predicted HD superfamily hydrolase
VEKMWIDQKSSLEQLNRLLEQGKQRRKHLLFQQYLRCINDLIATPTVQRLSQFLQHGDSDRLQHSLSVSYYAFVLARRFGLDWRSVARGALLHDLFFYYHQERKKQGWHVLEHPKIALANANAAFNLNEVEQEIIVCHMFPFCSKLPVFAETYLVSTVDKLCATLEGLSYVCRRLGRLRHKMAGKTEQVVRR